MAAVTSAPAATRTAATATVATATVATAASCPTVGQEIAFPDAENISAPGEGEHPHGAEKPNGTRHGNDYAVGAHASQHAAENSGRRVHLFFDPRSGPSRERAWSLRRVRAIFGRTSFMDDPQSLPALSGMANVRQSVFASLQTQIEAYTKKGGDLIPLHIGDTHLAPPAAALAVAGDALDLGTYGRPAGLEELREALAGFRRQRGLATAASAANVHVGCGCTHALFCAVRAVLDPGDAALVVSPFWPLITGLMTTGGVEPIQVPLTTELAAGEVVDIEARLEAALTPQVRAVYYVTPNNPDGHVMTRAELEAIARFAERHDLWVFADEVYADFVYAGEHVAMASLDGMAERTITSFSLSKSHGLAGARIGYIVAPTRVIDTARRVSNHTLYNVPVTMQRAALAAVETGERWLADALSTYHDAREAIALALADIGVTAVAPAGGSFFFFDVGERLGKAPLQALLERAIDNGVLLAPGDAFGTHFTTWLRLCFTGVPLDRTLEGVTRLQRALETSS